MPVRFLQSQMNRQSCIRAKRQKAHSQPRAVRGKEWLCYKSALHYRSQSTWQ